MPNPKVVAKVQGIDPSINKFQDQLLGVTNTFMRQVSENIGTMPVYDTPSRPVANASSAGQVIQLKNPGAAALVQVCLQKADGGFAWVTLANTTQVAAANGYTPVYSVADLPAADASSLGYLARIKDPGVAETLLVCMRKADDTYVWVRIVTVAP